MPYSPPSLDIYGGYNALSCTNTNTAFSLATINGRKMFCDPAGHGFFMRAPYTFDLNDVTTIDESGKGYNNYVLTKYVSASNWAVQSIGVMKSWGWNSLATYYSASSAAPNSTGQTNPVPVLVYGNISHYALLNTNGYACSSKNLYYSVGRSGNTTTWKWGTAGAEVTDYWDPCYPSYHLGFMQGGQFGFGIQSGTTAQKHYVIGVTDADSDNTHGLNAGPDFTAAQGNQDFRRGYLSFFLTPVNYANSIQAQVYTDGTVYEKKRFHDLVLAAHSNIGNVNSSWGSGYGTDLTSGTCFGSLHPSWLCPAPSPAFSVGTGDGVTKIFTPVGTLNTVVSKFSVYISVNGVIVGGDTGTGNLYGPGTTGLSGTVNYATGTISVTFTNAPANGAVITAGYIQNGWGIGNGFMDEDCRSAHSSYCGTPNTACGGSDCYAIYLCSSATQTTCLPTSVQTDINALTKDIATRFSSVGKNNVQTWAAGAGFVGPVLYFGTTTIGSWGVPPDRYVLQGYAGNVDVLLAAGSGSGFAAWTQAMFDFVHTYMGDMPIVTGVYSTANLQSAFSWPNSPCTHSGSSVTCTVATPNKFVATAGNFHIKTSCDNVDYNVSQKSFSATSTTVTYTANGTPSEPSAICNVAMDDANENGYATQNARCTDFQTSQLSTLNLTYTASGIKPMLGYTWWAWQDNWAEGINWGIVSVRDNPYNGLDDVNPTGSCTINPSFNCGGELTLHGPPLGDCVSLLAATNTTIDNTLITVLPQTPGCSVPWLSC